jgi:hypothetical protein
VHVLDEPSASGRASAHYEPREEGTLPVTTRDPRETIAAKPERKTLPPEEVERSGLAYPAGEIGDGPAAVFLMASLGEQVDPAVGIVSRPKIGDRIDTGGGR